MEFKQKSCRRSCSDIFVTAIDRIVQDFTNTKEIKIINILISQGGDGASKSEEDVICCLSGGYKIISTFMCSPLFAYSSQMSSDNQKLVFY